MLTKFQENSSSFLIPILMQSPLFTNILDRMREKQEFTTRVSIIAQLLELIDHFTVTSHLENGIKEKKRERVRERKGKREG